MIFRHLQEKLNPNGSTETLATDFDLPELLIGRGSNSNLLLPGRLISLVHAKVSWVDGKLRVEDQGSMAGVRVNGKRVTRDELSSGNELQIGDVRFTVEIAGDAVILRQKVPVAPKQSLDDIIDTQTSSLTLSNYLPSMTFLSLFGLFLIVFFYYLLPSFGVNKHSWSSGPLANPHKMIESNCQACHADGFVQVQDKQCLHCHNLSEHAKGFNKLVSHKPDIGLRCAQCHMDHNGDHGLIADESALCTNCHANLKSVSTEATQLSVTSFADHGEFRITVDDGTGKTTRVSLDDKTQAVDKSTLKLNHALHLKAGLRGKDGPVTLSCSSCHELATDFKTIKPIRFDNHCRDCHGLGFDPAIPEAQVPHGDNSAIYPALFTEYTKYLLMSGGEPAPVPPVEPGYERTLPGGTRAPSAAANIKPAAINASLVERRARAAEHELYTRTACFLCHETAETPSEKQTPTNAHYEVMDPKVPETWLSKAVFSHGSHEEVSCESCHRDTRKSTQTKDVLLPVIKDCRACHAQGNERGFVKSECIKCHSYHDALGIPAEKKKSIGDYITEIQR